MNMQRITCQEHNGTFTRPAQRGRPPRACSAENPCNRAGARKSNAKAVAARTAETLKGRTPDVSPETSGGRRPGKVAQATAERLVKQTGRTVKAIRGSSAVATSPVVSNNPSVPRAHDAKRILEPLGWQLKGRAWSEPNESDDGPRDLQFYASVIGKRGDETVTFLWKNGKLVSQDYIMWHTDKPSENGMPRKRLNFDPEEMSDSALVRLLSGQRIVWWNFLGKTTERAEFPHASESKVKIEHLMNGHGENEQRIVTFVDQTKNGTAFRSFNVNALLKVGS